MISKSRLFIYSISCRKTFWKGPLLSASILILISSKLNIMFFKFKSSNKYLIKSIALKKETIIKIINKFLKLQLILASNHRTISLRTCITRLNLHQSIEKNVTLRSSEPDFSVRMKTIRKRSFLNQSNF